MYPKLQRNVKKKKKKEAAAVVNFAFCAEIFVLWFGEAVLYGRVLTNVVHVTANK